MAEAEAIAATALSGWLAGESGVALRFPPQSKKPIGTKFKSVDQGGSGGQSTVGQVEYSRLASFYFGLFPNLSGDLDSPTVCLMQHFMKRGFESGMARQPSLPISVLDDPIISTSRKSKRRSE